MSHGNCEYEKRKGKCIKVSTKVLKASEPSKFNLVKVVTWRDQKRQSEEITFPLYFRTFVFESHAPNHHSPVNRLRETFIEGSIAIALKWNPRTIEGELVYISSVPYVFTFTEKNITCARAREHSLEGSNMYHKSFASNISRLDVRPPSGYTKRVFHPVCYSSNFYWKSRGVFSIYIDIDKLHM